MTENIKQASRKIMLANATLQDVNRKLLEATTACADALEEGTVLATPFCEALKNYFRVKAEVGKAQVVLNDAIQAQNNAVLEEMP